MEVDASASRVNWWSSDKCLAYYNVAVSGVPATLNSQGCRIRLAKEFPGRIFDRAVSIGCATGSKEMALITDGLVKHFDLWEINQASIDKGEQCAAELGLADQVTFRKGDVFADRSPRYDLVYWDHSLHHMSDVDDALAWSVSVLRPGGVILMNDYVGPNRLQWRKDEVRRANSFIRRAMHDRGIASREVPYSTLFSKLRQRYRDPSEAPQSENILQACAKNLPSVSVEPLGGTFINILGPIVIPAVADDSPVIDELLSEDAALRDEGSSHFVFALWSRP
ncbi:class I SAM-dependent methyltransferase [Phenylobacterium sp. LH3H17]|uniref:class I SAM-dependent methyltransferase n=1 Tax=Phenylobacterium sp. LH3H17 TaxID=2903901 RepID=UPI0020C9B5F6|nr:class I SAM-dependent methyltransferase [Phenylobacterium sp. LH3H17]UTP40975.1 class I SAM-dependent methyltransferase [Phenylobacterium sp. LH3H17]